ncbi:hypothetical protein C5C07_17255 [Haloferax sp. Atlit-4N]|uniref:enolase C-terminal domain-like protein n=1 Tax=Haloferax sp. Atlit-4N TaxID=2077206 RepID=UPI000E23FD3B|nr:enolase C-terminal domain-like protein [Haloferax sp. Atlit-4N]RDZ51335.1 hypothetical protein C5C07_17255 [Haloferax sp. Atlit-4N]
MVITGVDLWTIDYDSITKEVGSNPTEKSRPQNETFCVEIRTDTGERGVAVNRGGGESACKLIDDYFRPILEGSDPARIEHLWQEMYDALPTARGGLSYMALSGIDLSLWDLKGRATDRPVYDLLGGAVREELPCYVTVFPNVMESLSDEEFLGVKIPTKALPEDGLRGLDELETKVARAREFFGETADIMIDCFMDWNKEYTVRAADRLQKYDLKWIEDPLPAGHTVQQYRDIRNEVKPVQLAVGNVEYGHRSFHQLVNQGAADIIQPDIQWAGGMTEMNRVGHIAKPMGIPVIPHRSNIYSCHYALARHDTPYVEYMLGRGTEVQPVRPAADGELVPSDGTITVPTKPGFGIELNKSVLNRFVGSE